MKQVTEDHQRQWRCEVCREPVSFRGPHGEPEHTEDETTVCELAE